MKNFIYSSVIFSFFAIVITVPAQERFDALTLSEALEFTMENNLDFTILQKQIQMADADAEQAGLFPNPVLSGGMEAITTDTDINNPEQRQDIIGITQSIPLFGTLQKAQRVSELEREQYQAELDILKTQLSSQAKTAFYEVVYYQEVIKQLSELQSILNDVLQVSKSRLEQGDIAAIEVIRVEANNERFSIESEIAESNLANAKTQLATIMGNSQIMIGECNGELETESVDFPLEQTAQFTENPLRKLVWEKRESKAKAEIEKAKTGAYPELEIGTNYRRFDVTDQDTFDFTIGISVPIFNRNQGAIRYQMESLELEKSLIAKEKNELNEQVKITTVNIKAHQERISRFKNSILPKIEETSQISQTSYSAGDVSILEVLDSYRNLVESRLTYLQELNELKKSVIQLETLTGKEF
jgi:cobalt-zinc-cadmium efflux system outer membrane protein